MTTRARRHEGRRIRRTRRAFSRARQPDGSFLFRGHDGGVIRFGPVYTVTLFPSRRFTASVRTELDRVAGGDQ